MDNPILKGFNPDPSICRRKDEFYLATSSFQWWPGVPIYRSRDLRHWALVTYALTRTDQLDLHRIADSCGIWAPCLSYADGLFWLIFTVASTPAPRNPDCPNYLTTAPDIVGPWSEPVYLNARGNDPSLFHDDDGRKWLICSNWERSPGQPSSHGCLLQEYSVAAERLVGESLNPFQGTALGTTEGSKLFKRNGWYYIVVAEGGTSYGHAATMARSRNLEGPFEVHPDNPLLTAAGTDLPIQKAGHGDIIDLSGDRAAVVYLGSRPIDGKCALGRETFIIGAHWDADDWLRCDSPHPMLEVPDFGFEDSPVAEKPQRDDFDAKELDGAWNSLRGPIDERTDLHSRPGWLVLTPTPNFLDSLEHPTLLARRAEHHAFSAEALMAFAPRNTQQWAGIVCYYDTLHWYFLHKQYDTDAGQNTIALYARRGPTSRLEGLGTVAAGSGELTRLGVECDGRLFRFRFAAGVNNPWQAVGVPQDALALSDDSVGTCTPYGFAFTGMFVGLACYDLTETGPKPAFDWFDYKGHQVWSGLPCQFSSS